MEGYREGEMKLTFMLCLDEAIDNFMGTLKWWDLQIHNEKSVKLLISFFGCVCVYIYIYIKSKNYNDVYNFSFKKLHYGSLI